MPESGSSAHRERRAGGPGAAAPKRGDPGPLTDCSSSSPLSYSSNPRRLERTASPNPPAAREQRRIAVPTRALRPPQSRHRPRAPPWRDCDRPGADGPRRGVPARRRKAPGKPRPRKDFNSLTRPQSKLYCAPLDATDATRQRRRGQTDGSAENEVDGHETTDILPAPSRTRCHLKRGSRTRNPGRKAAREFFKSLAGNLCGDSCQRAFGAKTE